MTRLPAPGGDRGTWGDILNEFLRVAHAEDGTLQAEALKAAGAVTAINNSPAVDGSVILSAADIGAAAELGELNDVETSFATDSDVLTYSAGSNTWRSRRAPVLLHSNVLIGLEGTSCVAVRTADSSVLYRGIDAGAALTAAMAALGTDGGDITFKPGSYTWMSVPALPANLNGWLRILGNMATINLSTLATRFLDFDKQANGDTFRYLWVDGFTVDAAALASTGGAQHVIIGTYRPNDGVTSGTNVNFEYLVLRNLRSVNVRSADSSVAHFLNIFIGIHQDVAGRPQNHGRHILVEHCDLNGGNYGVAIYGNKTSAWSGDPSIVFDDIVVRHIRHDRGPAPTSFDFNAHVHIGSLGHGDNVIVEDVWGNGSRDVGVEVDAMMNARVANVSIENHFGFAVALTNFNTPLDYRSQHVYVTNATSRRDAGLAMPSSASVVGIRTTPGYPNGHFTLQNVRHYRTASAPDLATSPIAGDLVSAKGALESLTIKGGHYEAVGVRLSGSGSQAAQIIYVDDLTTTRTRLTFEDIDVRFRGAKTSGATAGVAMAAVQVNGSVDVDIRNVRLFVDFPNIDQMTAVDLGGGSGGTMRGRIEAVKVSGPNLGPNAKGVFVPSSATVTIPFAGALRVRDVDDDALPAGAAISAGDATNKALIDTGTQALTAAARTVTADYQVTSSDGVVLVDSAAPVVVTLPSATVSGPGKQFVIKPIGSGTTSVNALGGTIDGDFQVIIPGPVTYASDGTDWRSISSMPSVAMSQDARTVTANHALTQDDAIVRANGSGITLTLPSGTISGAGKQFLLFNAGNSDVAVNATGGMIDGGFSLTLRAGIGIHVASDGTDWLVLQRIGRESLRHAGRTVTGNYTATPADGSIFVNGSSVTVTLPSATTSEAGKQFLLKNIGSNDAQVNALGGDVEGMGQVTLSAGTSAWFTSDGTDWWRSGS